MKQFFVVMIAVLLIFPQAFAQSKSGKMGASGFYFEETFMPLVVGVTNTRNAGNAGAAKETGSGFDSKTTLGYVFGGAWFVGLTSNSYTLTTKRSNRVGGDEGKKEKTQNSQMGATVGYLHNNWRFMFTSYLSGKKSVHEQGFDQSGATGDLTVKNKNITGSEIVVGYLFPISSNFGIGPSLVYKSFSYGKQFRLNKFSSAPTDTYAYKSLSDDATETNLDLLISLVARF